MTTIIANGNGFSIGYDDDGTAVQSDTFGEWIPAREGSTFVDGWRQEYRCYDGEWCRTDERGNVMDARDPLDIYRVDADADTGEWITDPRATGETAIYSAWNERADTEVVDIDRGTTEIDHYDTYEVDGRMRAIIVHMVYHNEPVYTVEDYASWR